MPTFLKKPIVSLHACGFVFTPKILPTLLFMLILPGLLQLGFWQLRRADQKRLLETRYAIHQQGKPLSLQQAALKKVEYYPIQVAGRYDTAHQFFVDNRMYNHRAGYNIITPFIPTKMPNKRLLVNRGWIPRGADRRILPTLDVITPHHTITGFIKTPHNKPFVLSHTTSAQGWPRLIQAVDLKKMQRALKRPLYPFLVLLSPNAPNGFTRDWTPNRMRPEKHVGYAIQWFALSFTLVMIYLVVNTRRGRRDDTRKQPH